MTNAARNYERYGYREVNNLRDVLSEEQIEQHRAATEVVPWTEPGLKVVRLRLLTDRDFPAYDVSYCWGLLEGRPVRVELPFSQLPKRPGIFASIVLAAKRDGVYAKGLGIFQAVSIG